MTTGRDAAYVNDQRRRAARSLLGLGAAEPDDSDVEYLAREMAWLTCVRGESVCEQGEPSDAVFIIAGGRAVAIHRDETTATTRVVGEIGPNEIIGEMGMLTGEPRSATIVCTRDSELVRLDRPTFERLMTTHPRLLLTVSQTVIQRLRRQVENRRTPPSGTIAILPAGSDDSGLLGGFADALAAALGKHSATRYVTRADLPVDLADELARDASAPRVVDWLNHLERTCQYVILQADSHPSTWTERCLRQADRLLFVARAECTPEPGPLEQQAARLAAGVTAAHQELVLLQTSAARLPYATGRWLELRAGQLERHHHVHLGTPATVERVARFVAGRAVGLALGGGGARGFAHIGVVRALREAGVPIDVVAGTSMGSVIGAQCALGWSTGEMLRRSRVGFIDQHPLSDYTLPLVAAYSGRGAARMLRGLYGDVQLEDLWTTFVAVSSNMTQGTVAAHTHGRLRKYVRASMSVPGLLPPVTEHGDLLVDGGVLNNLPADIVRDLVGSGAVIAVDVNPRHGLRAPADYGEILDGWEVAWRRFSPRPLAVPGIHDVLERMTNLGSIHQAAQSVQATADLYLHPPTDMVRFLDFHAMDAHAERGYQFARPLVAEWASQTGYANEVRWSG